MKRAGIYELKAHLSEHLRLAEAGEVIEVMDRARPIARIVPIEREGSGLETVAASTTFARVRRVRLPAVKLAMSSLEVLSLERGSR